MALFLTKFKNFSFLRLSTSNHLFYMKTLRVSLYLISILTASFSTISAQDSPKDWVDQALEYAKAAQYDSATFWYDKAISAFKEANNHNDYIETRVARAVQVEGRQSNFNKEEKMELEILEEYKALGIDNPSVLNKLYRSLGFIYYRRDNDNQKALRYYWKALATNSQLEKDLTTVYNNLSQLYLQSRVLDSANYYLDLNIDLINRSEELGEETLWTLYRLKGLSYILGGDGPNAKVYIHKARKILEKQPEDYPSKYQYLGVVYSNLFSVSDRMGEPDSASVFIRKEKRFKELSPLTSDMSLGLLYSNYSADLYQYGRYDSAAYYVKKSIELKERAVGPDNSTLAYSYLQYGSVMQAKSASNDQAIVFFQEAARIFEKVFGPDHFELGTAYSNIAAVYGRRKDFKKALEYYLKSKEIRIKTTPTHELTAELFGDIGQIYLYLNDLESALKSYDKGLAIMRANFPENHRTTAHLLSEKAWVLWEGAGEFEEALDHFAKAEKMIIALGIEKGFDLTSLYLRKVRLMLKTDSIAKGIETLKKAIHANTYSNWEPDVLAYPKRSDVIGITHFLETMMAHADLLKRQYELSGKIEDLKGAIDLYRQASDFVVDFAVEKGPGADLLSIQENYKSIFDNGLKLQFELFRQTESEDLKVEMFEYIERSRALTLKLVNRGKEISLFHDISPELIGLQNTIDSDLVYYQEQIRTLDTTNDSIRLIAYNQNIFKLQKTQDSLADGIRDSYPAYYEFQHGLGTSAVTEIQREIMEDQVLLAYHIIDSTAFAFVLGKNSTEVIQLPVTTNLDSLITEFNLAIVDRNHKLYAAKAYKLYQTLFEPLEGLFTQKNITVIPDGPIWNLHFDLLLSSLPANPESTKDFEYLIKQYAFNYAYSTSLPFNAKAKKSNKNTLLAFAYGDNFGETLDAEVMRNTELNDLPGSAKEIQQAANMFKGKTYYGKEANEGNFKKEAGNYQVLHLAIHGEVDNQEPSKSKMFFTPTEADTIDDGFLYPYELYGMDLNASLAVLTACNTGAGKVTNGEGVMSLGRAFRYAGVKSLVLSQWEVSDGATPEIMEAFYSNLKDGMRKDEALRQAKLNFLENVDNIGAVPYLWGSLFVMGDPSEIDFTDNRLRNMAYVIAGLLILILVMRRFRRGHQS